MSEPLSLVFELARTESLPVLLTGRSAAAFRAAIVVALAASHLAVADDKQPSPASSSTLASSFDNNNATTATAGEVIVVTGTRSETPLAASPVTTEVIDRKRLEESGAQTVSEALTLRPGLWIDRGVAGTSGITIQGLGPQYSLILVDGARQIGRTDGYLDLDRSGIADIEQIEIVRGPSSELHFENPSVGYVVDGNPDLKPEISRSAQGGAEWQATRWMWLSVNGYYNSLHDLIYAITEPDDGSGTLRFGYGNVGHARTAGLESYAMLVHGRAGLELGYALTRARDLDDERPLEGVPQHRFTAIARWRDAEGFDAFAALVVTGHRPYYFADDPQLATPSPRRVEIRARIAKRFRSGYGGFLGVDNLLDAGDANLDRIPPRTVYAGVEMHL